MTTTARHLQPSDYVVMPWKNGGGTTTELAREPDDGGDSFLWRISIATVDQAGPFSKFEGHERIITLLSGAGMTLDFGDTHPSARLDKRLTPFRFSGDWQTNCRLLGGTITDFNVIAARGKIAARVEAIECGTKGASASIAGESAFLHIVEGRVHCDIPGEQSIVLATSESLLWRRQLEPNMISLTSESSAMAILVDFAKMG